jgi:hypothetical protein
MRKFSVTILEHRSHRVTVEAEDEDAAMRVAQRQLEAGTADLSKGDTSFAEPVDAEPLAETR